MEPSRRVRGGAKMKIRAVQKRPGKKTGDEENDWKGKGDRRVRAVSEGVLYKM